ncbi:YggT family protein [Eubacterium sp. 1001713B170207_170306_E7]|uniref:YggT family protein n=1 Tax=Eubacterium sp. 1001713B170207_170306_E7 TaxID=2787097 RepID=UPI00189BBE59|nr:YggT family protein [Eubacterium sp. 1001713B170207_170306_E7]
MIENILLVAGQYLVELITLLIVANILMSWFNPSPDNPIVKVIYGLTEPILSPLRRFAIIGPIDFSGIAAVVLLQFIIFPLYKMLISAIF